MTKKFGGIVLGLALAFLVGFLAGCTQITVTGDNNTVTTMTAGTLTVPVSALPGV